MHNGIAPRIEYRFTDPSGETRENDVMLELGAWEMLRAQPSVEVVYLPDDPSVHRPLVGYADSAPFEPALAYPLAVIGALMGLFFCAMGIVAFLGYDIKVEGVRVSVIRLGADQH